jgi:hypothetical protein
MRYAKYALVVLALAVPGCMNESPVAVDQGLAERVPSAPKTVPFEAHEENTIIVTAPPPLLETQFPGTIEGDHIGSERSSRRPRSTSPSFRSPRPDRV